MWPSTKSVTRQSQISLLLRLRFSDSTQDGTVHFPTLSRLAPCAILQRGDGANAGRLAVLGEDDVCKCVR